jgi:hypothetical protein
MPSTYTTNGGIELPANGEQSGTWGETVNDNMSIIDRLTNGVGSISLSGTTHTLTTTDGTLSDGQYNVLVLGGSPSGTNTITISPNDGEHVYIVKNISGQTATFTQGSGASISVLNNTTKIIYADGAGAGAAVVDITGALDLGSLIIAGTSVTATAAELNYNDITTLGTVQASKTVTADASGDVLFPDGDKAIFGAGSDASIFSDGTSGYARGFSLQNASGSKDVLTFADGGATTLYYDNASKLATTATGIDVTGNVNVTGADQFKANSSSSGDYVRMYGSSGTGKWDIYGNGANLRIGDNESLGVVQVDTGLNVLGDVGVGTSSPAAKLEVASPASTPAVLRISSNKTGTGAGDRDRLDFYSADNSGTAYQLGYMDYDRADTTGTASYVAWASRVAGTVAERYRIDSSGTVLVAKSSDNNDVGCSLRASGAAYFVCNSNAALLVNRLGSDGTVVQIYNDSNGVGSISVSGASTAYNTSSDYRLKTDAQPMTGASDRVLALKPINFAWIASGDRVDGFLAHEAQAIVPECVTGTKDAMRDEEYEVTAAIEATYDEDGNELTAAVEAVMGTRSVPDMQGIDQSKLVPLLTAALQEALTKIADMEIRLSALEG